MYTSQISKNKDKLTGTDEMIASYLKKKYGGGKDNVMVSSEQIARNVGCGQATVIRFSQKLGYTSFKSMMLDLINESFFLGDSDIKYNEDIRSTAKKLQYQYDQAIKEVLHQNSDDELENAISLLESAHCILCFGVRSSSAIASIMYYRFMETGCNCIFANQTMPASAVIYNMTANDVILMISVSGETSDNIKVAQLAKKKGVKIISITGSRNNTINSLSNVALKCAEFDVHTNKINLVNRSSQLFLIDLLFIRLWRNNEEKFVKQTEEFNHDTSIAISDKGILRDGTYRL